MSRPANAVGKGAFIYGTAWKGKRTTSLVLNAVAAGFRGFDVAAQPKHYREDLEDLMGLALRTAIRYQGVSRAELFSSLRNFRPGEAFDGSDSYIDSLLLHSPLRTLDETMLAWKKLECFVPSKISALGISNVTLPLLEALYSQATVKPAVVQNRFHAATAYDVALRRFCQQKEIRYQSFWTLTANPGLLRSRPVQTLAAQLRIEPAVALYGLVVGLGNITILNGTTNTVRMKKDLKGVKAIEKWAAADPSKWEELMSAFKKIIGE
ncbi:hypothetical protein LTR66_008387 [Elasticomyces elasticus]|nr:hypothetical protein LTR66_008387 [Elasticomyces elasticus]KAK5005821.1 hypothetical protein LTR28_007238 [Elasticomyces elasticus]